MGDGNVTPIDAARPTRALVGMCKQLGLDPKQAGEHGLVALAPHEAHAAVGTRQAGIGFIYHQLDGTPIGVHRVRFVEPPEGTPKYKQPEASIPHIYLPQGHGIAWESIARNGAKLLVITEGEKKAHAGCVAGVPTVGIGGVWMGAKKKVTSGKLLVPELRALVGKCQHVVVAFDSDKVENPQVQKAEAELVALLLGMNVAARTVTLPPGPDGEKQGLDDYLMAEGKGRAAARMTKLLAESEAAEDLNAEWVKQQNNQWAYIENVGHEPYVLIDEKTRMRLGTFDSTFAAKRATFDVLGKLVKVGEGELWRTHPLARRYKAEVFHTTTDAPPAGCLNRYAPPTKPEGYKAVSLKPMHEFVRAICTEEEQRVLYSWVAYAVQTGLRPEWGAFVWSEIQGAGKTMLGKLLGAVFAPYYAHLDTADLIGKWGRKEFENRRYLLVDEGESEERSGRRLEEMLKHALSGGTITVEEKFQPTRVVANRALVYLASNYQMTRHVSRTDRRTYMLHITRAVPVPIAKAADALLHERPGDRASPFRADTRWALWQYFSKYKLVDGFDPVRAPMNAAKQDAIEAGYSARERAVRSLMETGDWCDARMPEVVTTRALATLALQGKPNVSTFERLSESITIGKALAQAHCERRAVKVAGVVEIHWAVRNVELWKKRAPQEWAKEAAKLPVSTG